MKKAVIAFLIIQVFTFGLFSSDFALNFNIKYNAGNSGFFGNSSTLLMSEGFNYLEKSKYSMGVGFGLDLFIPLHKKIYIIPGISVDYGHRAYEFTGVETASDADMKDNFYFHIFRGDLKLNYDILSLKNGWIFSVLGGIGYNNVKADSEINTGEKKYWNVLAGFGVKFFQLKHFGFNLLTFYNYPLKNKKFEYLTVSGGILYRF